MNFHRRADLLTIVIKKWRECAIDLHDAWLMLPLKVILLFPFSPHIHRQDTKPLLNKKSRVISPAFACEFFSQRQLHIHRIIGNSIPKLHTISE
jgi:hypothetical protein